MRVYHEFQPTLDGTDPTKVRKAPWVADHIIEGSNTVLADLSGLTDGATTTFVTPDYFIEDTTRVFLNGLIQRPIIDYSEGTLFDGIVMVAAPALADDLLVEYMPQES